MASLRIHHHIKHHISRIRHRARTPEISLYLKDPMVVAAFLAFGMIALVLSIISFAEALLY